MSFRPVLPLDGYAGWVFLKRTLAGQRQQFAETAGMRRDAAHFRDRIAGVTAADELVADRQLLKVALGAHGLDRDIDNKAFIRKVLADGTLEPGDLANRLADKSYRNLSAAFGFGDYATPSTQLSDFADRTLELYARRQFELAVGEQNNGYRLALNAERALGELAGSASGENAKWYSVMGNKPLRSFMETALGLPSNMAALDVDQQLAAFRSRTAALFGDGTVSQFVDTAKVERLVRAFITRDAAAGATAGTSGAAAALVLLRR